MKPPDGRISDWFWKKNAKRRGIGPASHRVNEARNVCARKRSKRSGKRFSETLAPANGAPRPSSPESSVMRSSIPSTFRRCSRRRSPFRATSQPKPSLFKSSSSAARASVRSVKVPARPRIAGIALSSAKSLPPVSRSAERPSLSERVSRELISRDTVSSELRALPGSRSWSARAAVLNSSAIRAPDSRACNARFTSPVP